MAYADREKAKEASRRWYENNKEKQRAASKLRYEQNKGEWIKKTNGYAMKRKYGLTPLDKEQMIVAQDFKCAICEKSISMDRFSHIDHCHKTGKVRGILCINCNRGLGAFEDDPDRIETAIKYLETCG